MPPSESTFTDWQQDDENDRRPLMDEEFSWSEPPARPRRRSRPQPVRERRSHTVVLERDAWDAQTSEPAGHASPEPEHRDPAVTEAEFEAARQLWSDAYSHALDQAGEAAALEHYCEFDRDDVASYANARVVEDRSGALDLSDSGRRTVIITGRGDARYIPQTRRRQARSSASMSARGSTRTGPHSGRCCSA